MVDVACNIHALTPIAASASTGVGEVAAPEAAGTGVAGTEVARIVVADTVVVDTELADIETADTAWLVADIVAILVE